MHSLLAGRILLELRELGKRSVHGEEFKDFGSSFAVHVNTLQFEAFLATVDEGDDSTDNIETTPTTLGLEP
jgi:hypothetical protein